MTPSDSTPPPTSNSAAKQDTAEIQSAGAEDGDVFDVFGEWNSIPDHLSLYSRVLISEIAVSFAQSGGQEKIEKYAADLKPEMRRALCDRAKQIVETYTDEVASSLKQGAVESTWIDAVKWGVASHLEDFAISQNESFRDLSEFIRERTSFRAQAFIAFAVALFLAIFIGATRFAVTIWDDIHPDQISRPSAGAPEK
ncbi:MAG: hypothetical protein WDN08_12385 [Rhizomicrobium sp.]